MSEHIKEGSDKENVDPEKIDKGQEASGDTLETTDNTAEIIESGRGKMNEADRQAKIKEYYEAAFQLMKNKTDEGNQKALEELEQLLALDPEHIKALIALVKVYNRLNQSDKATAKCLRVIDILKADFDRCRIEGREPEPEALFQCAATYMRLGESDPLHLHRALGYLELLEEMNPQYKGLQKALKSIREAIRKAKSDQEEEDKKPI